MNKPATVTLDIDSPFDMQLSPPFLLKSDRRLPMACGELIVGVSAVNAATQQSLATLVDGASLSQRDEDLLWECDMDPSSMWMTEDPESMTSLEFDLGRSQPLGSIKIWNYNTSDHTDWGVRQIDVSVWTEQDGWRTVLNDAQLTRAEGTYDYDEPTMLQLDGHMTTRVRFSDLRGFKSNGSIGLSEVQFYHPRTAQACKPTPTSGTMLYQSGDIPICWTSGVKAVKQQIYLGLDEHSLKLAGTTNTHGVGVAMLEGCVPNARYYWRIDTVQADGTVIQGALWTFTTALLVSHWTLDEATGTTVHDRGPYDLHGEVKGRVDWRPTEGKTGGALMLDGRGCYVDLPDAVGSGASGKTIALWAYPTANPFWARFVEFGNGEHHDNILFARFDRSDILAGSICQEETDGDWVLADGTIENHTWQFLAMTVQPDGRIMLYKNGLLVKTGDDAVSLRAVTRVNNYIGRSNYSADAYYRGMIDDVWIINAVLNPDQIKDLYDGKGYQSTIQGGKEVPLPTLTMNPPMPQNKLASADFESSSQSRSRWLILMVVVAILIVIGTWMGRKKIN